LKGPKTSGIGRTPVHHTIPLGTVIFLVYNYFKIILFVRQVIIINLYQISSMVLFIRHYVQIFGYCTASIV